MLMTSHLVSRAARCAGVGVLAACILAAFAAADIAAAQGRPFGMGGGGAAPAAPHAVDGLIGWILAKQSEFYRGLSGMIRAAKADGTAVVGLLGLSFAYGVFHAAGPGHGKAVISSYLVASGETWRRGVVLSFASALLQALTAITLVAVAAGLLNVTSSVMRKTVNVIEWTGYALIIAIGLRLLWVKGHAFVAALQALRPQPALAVAGAAAALGHDHASDHAHASRLHDHGHHSHDHDHGHGHHHHHGEACAACGHAHGPEPKDLAGPGGWRRGLSAIVAVGLRPCAGAIMVLGFALAHGLFWAGAAATLVMGLGTALTVAAIATLAVGARGMAARLAGGGAGSGIGMLALRGIELGAALLVTTFGVLLLMGYMASEQLFGV
jgi:nickel/cobalt transporter (NicO) family protein